MARRFNPSRSRSSSTVRPGRDAYGTRRSSGRQGRSTARGKPWALGVFDFTEHSPCRRARRECAGKAFGHRGYTRALVKRRLKRRLAHSVADLLAPYLFDVHVQDKLSRQGFFFNAFRALFFNRIDGDYAEFGTGGGMTFSLAYRESRRHGHAAKLWGFDSFQGLPAPKESDAHPRWSAGKMATTQEQFHAICSKNGIPRDAYEVVPGFFDQTLATMSPTDAPTDIALAYIDCDLHSSTQDVLGFLQPRLKHGMIVAFDDYYCWSASQISGNRKAMLEFSSGDSRWEWVPYLQIGWHGKSFVIEDTESYPSKERARYV